MSLRVLSGSLAAEARPLFGYIETGTPIQPPAPEEPSEAPPEPETPHEVLELHARILDLEKTLQREVRNAREAGFREGEAAGRERASAELQPVIERLMRGITDVATLRSRIRRDAESELVQLSMAIARRILRRELTVDPDAMLGLVKAALEKVQARDVCRIRVHPDQHAAAAHYMERAAAISGVEVVADRSLQPGDVFIETRRGDLDASIETQLSEIERGFADRLRK